MSTVGIIDYGMGNLRSIFNAFTFVGARARFLRSPEEFIGADRLVLPGVGSFPAAAANLRSRGLDAAIRSHTDAGRPLLGICLGMQLLASHGTEHGGASGLDVIPGEVVPLQPGNGERLPHVGWNSVAGRRPHPVLEGVKASVDFYFVHSFRFVPRAAVDGVATTDYGGEFVSVSSRGSAVGVQFHPEKSQDYGLRILENFCRWEGAC